MNSKITSEHLCRGAAVYIRQSTLSQVLENTESQQRQYELAEAARTAGFAAVTVIDDDLGRSGSRAAERPGFQKLAAAVCAGSVGDPVPVTVFVHCFRQSGHYSIDEQLP